MANEFLRQCPRISPLANSKRQRGESLTSIVVDERLDELVVRDRLLDIASTGRDQFEGRQGVAGRAAALGQNRFDSGLGDGETSVLSHPANVLFQLVDGEQMEFKMLHSRTDRGADFLRIGCRQHKYHVWRRLFQRLQKGGFGTLGQHVYFVKNVDLVASWRSKRCLFDEVTHGLDAVVAGRVQLVNVEAGTGLDSQARVARATRLAVVRVGAVEHLGQYPSRCGFAGAPGSAEQVTLTLARVDDRIAQRDHNVILAFHFAEAAWSVPAVKGLNGHCVEPTECKVPTSVVAGRYGTGKS